MIKKKKHLVQDFLLLLVSIGLAVFLSKAGLIHRLVLSFDGLSWLGVFIAGSFFTSVFTTAPAIALLGELSHTTPLPLLVVLGAFGAMVGDYVIFLFVRDRVSEDISYLLSLSKYKRFPHIFRTHLFKFFVPFLGALVIASPLPDELGVILLGTSKLKDKYFFLISFVMNGLGILAIALIARAVVGV